MLSTPNRIQLPPRDVLGRIACIIEMIQRNRFLKELHIDKPFQDNTPVTTLAPSILRATIVYYLPQQLHELEINVGRSTRYPPCCIPQYDRLMAQTEVLQLRRLFFTGFAECFMVLMFLPLLKRCPDLEELALSPVDSKGSRQDNFNEWVQVQRNGEIEVLKTIVSSVTANTIEVLRVFSWNYQGDQVIRILRQCPRLREFRVRSKGLIGVDVSDLVEAMEDEIRACWDTLQVLRQRVNFNFTISSTIRPDSLLPALSTRDPVVTDLLDELVHSLYPGLATDSYAEPVMQGKVWELLQPLVKRACRQQKIRGQNRPVRPDKHQPARVTFI
ncbi:MAG: hypothetical protein J3Q66DRAFT_395639 [Benniella sp.]|nr:MAG: hypothetical protein J3Q66DRAFT_395639 [Benniella sp.]